MRDFLIIGAGIAGLSAAARLAPLGGVTVLEAEEAPGFHASGRSAALYEPNYGARATVALNRASGAELAEAGVLGPRGLMVVATETDADAFAADRRAMKLTELGPAEARARLPILAPAVTRAAITEAAQDIDTDLLLQGYARTARSHGAEIRTRAAVTAIARTAQGWRLETAAGPVEGRVIVNAAGAWADAVARMAGLAPLGIRAFRRSIAQLPAPGGRDVRGWPMVVGAGETWYAKPDAGNWLVSPADADPAEPHDAFADDMVVAEGLARYEAMVTEPVTRVLTSWAGLRSYAPDRTLVIGPDPHEPAFAWLAGQGGQGFQSAPAAARLLADRLAGRAPAFEPALVAALAPERLR